jgi:hypothetical protein
MRNLATRSNLTFFPQFVLGYLGMPRRYYEYPPEFQVLNVMSTAGASILAVGYVLPLAYLLLSLRHPPNAGPNPWRATGLEWQADSRPPVHNFEALTATLPKEPRPSMETVTTQHTEDHIRAGGEPIQDRPDHGPRRLPLVPRAAQADAICGTLSPRPARDSSPPTVENFEETPVVTGEPS